MSNLMTVMRRGSAAGDIGQQIDDLLQKGYKTQTGKEKFQKKKSFSPSTLGWQSGRCPRRWQYMFNGVTVCEDNGYMSIATMGNGTAAHERLQQALKDSGADVTIELPVTCFDPPIRGYVDARLPLEGYGDVPLELKTTRMESFDYRRATGEPADYHLVQILIYMKIMGSKYGAVVYENRNDQSILTIPVEMNEKNTQRVEDMFDWMRQVYAAWQNDVVVARPVKRRNAVLCKDCPVKGICWSEPGEGLELPLLP